ncbi:MAG: hypothetical protein NTV43_12265 [Methylococcales bacterium]|nr:hypothetical protein [Methylococcales bacterium]
MRKQTLVVTLSAAFLVVGCASMGKEGRVGLNDGSDPCFLYLDKLDDTAIYYKDQRMQDIAAGVVIGGATGVMVGLLAGKTDTAAIIGGLAGAVAGGFAADAYWKNKLQTSNNQANLAARSIEGDIKSDINRLTSVDNDIAALVRCRTLQRDKIKRLYAERKLTLQQAQQEWKKWGDALRKDREEMKYLNEALDNVKKIEESYNYAATASESSLVITEDMRIQWQQELNIAEEKELAVVEETYKEKLSSKRIKSKEKKKLKKEKKQKDEEIKKKYVSKKAEIKNTKVNPKGNPTKLLVAAIPEKTESIKKHQGEHDNLAVEAANDTGFQDIRGQLVPGYNGPEMMVCQATILP